MKLKIITSILTLSILSGCSTVPKEENTTYNNLDLDETLFNFDRVEKALEKSIVNTSKGVLARSKMRNAEKKEVLSHDQIAQINWEKNYVPVGMDRVINFYWDHSFYPALDYVAKKAGYTLVEDNPNQKPLNYIPVTIDTELIYIENGKRVKKNRIKDVIDFIAAQIDSYGIDIDIIEDSSLIVVKYGVK